MKLNILTVLLFIGFFTAEAQRGIGTPSADPSAVLELKSASKGFLPPRLTTAQRDAIILPVTGLTIFNSTKGCLEWYNGMVWYSGCGSQESSGGTAVVSSYNCAGASAGSLTAGTAVSGVTQTITAVVAAAGTYTISAAANGVTFSGSGVFWAAGTQDIVLTASGTPLAAETSNFILNAAPSCNFSRITEVPYTSALCNGSQSTTVVPVTSVTTKIWMDRNLGASRAAVSFDDYQAYGCLYQWGRGSDDHASIKWTSSAAGTPVNGTTTTLSTTDSAPNALFIVDASSPNDWRSPQNNMLWQGVSGINNPCPSGYRLPTSVEFINEKTANSLTNMASGYASAFKFTAPGNRNYGTGALVNTGTIGAYWSSTVNGLYVNGFHFNNAGSSGGLQFRNSGIAVRCIKD